MLFSTVIIQAMAASSLLLGNPKFQQPQEDLIMCFGSKKPPTVLPPTVLPPMHKIWKGYNEVGNIDDLRQAVAEKEAKAWEP